MSRSALGYVRTSFQTHTRREYTMGSTATSLVRCSMVGAIMLLALIIAPVHGHATAADDSNTGKILQTLNLAGTSADCATTNVGVGSSLAVVRGAKVGFPDKPVLLVTSCLATGSGGASKRATLYFVDPGSVLAPGPATATVVKTLQTKLGSAI